MRLRLTANDGTIFLDLDNPEAFTAEEIGNEVHDALMRAIDYESSEPTIGHTVKAECHSDDHIFTAEFDAAPWFEQASDEEIVGLWECAFGGDWAADEVARFIAERNTEVAAVLDYATKKHEMGFECHVDTTEAMAYIEAHRPEVAKYIQLR